MAGFQISIGLSPFANEDGEPDDTPAHHAQSFDGNTDDFHRLCHQGHKCLTLHHKAKLDGDERSAEAFGKEGMAHFAKADRIAGRHNKSRQQAYGEDGEDGDE